MPVPPTPTVRALGAACAAALVVLAAALPAHAADLSGVSAYGYASGTFQIGCTTCPHYVLVLGPDDPAPLVGGPGATLAAFDTIVGPDRLASGIPDDYTLRGFASMAARASFEGANATPMLGARAAADNESAFLLSDPLELVPIGVDYYGVSATAEAVQRYTYTGPGSATYTFSFSVDGRVTDSRSSVFGAAGFYDDILEVNYAFGSVLVEGQGLGWEENSEPVVFSESFDVTMTFNAGESYYMKTWLTANVLGMYASDPAFADAFHTLHVTGITGGDASLLVAGLAAPVPEPAAWSAMLAGLLAIGLRLGRRRIHTIQ